MPSQFEAEGGKIIRLFPRRLPTQREGDQPSLDDSRMLSDPSAGAAFLRRESAEVLTEELSVIMYAVDANNRLIYINRAWDEFFERNGPEDTALKPELGCELFPSTASSYQDFFRHICDSVRRGEIPYWEQVIPCHAPNQARWMLSRIQRLDELLVFSNFFLRAYAQRAPQKQQVRCIFTHREKLFNWEVDPRPPGPKTVYGLCPDCSLQISVWLLEGKDLLVTD